MMKTLSGAPPPPIHHTYSLFTSYSKLMKLLSGASLLPQDTFLLQFLFKTEENALWRPSCPRVHIPHSILIQNWWTSSVEPPSSSSSSYSVFKSFPKIMKILSGASFHHSTYSLFNSYSKLMKILCVAAFLLQYIFGFQVLFKTDGILSGASFFRALNGDGGEGHPWEWTPTSRFLGARSPRLSKND